MLGPQENEDFEERLLVCSADGVHEVTILSDQDKAHVIRPLLQGVGSIRFCQQKGKLLYAVGATFDTSEDFNATRVSVIVENEPDKLLARIDFSMPIVGILFRANFLMVSCGNSIHILDAKSLTNIARLPC